MPSWVDKSKGETREWNPTEPMQELLDRCEELGFKIRQNGQYHNYATATHDELGVKFSISQTYRPPYKGGDPIGQYNIQVQARVKSTHDSWVVPNYGKTGPWKETYLNWEQPHEGATVKKRQNSYAAWLKPDPKDVKRIIDEMAKFRGASKERRANRNKIEELYAPLALDAEFIQEDSIDTGLGQGTRQMKKGVALRYMFRKVVVIGFAVINEDLYINDVDANAPDADPWFHLAAETETAHPHIMVRQREDGIMEYYPARRAGQRYRISQNTTPTGTYIDFKGVTKLDAMLIEAAIQQFVDGL